MSDLIQKLYETLTYPAMSHPLADPAVSTMAARLGGLAAPDPTAARMVEIGCSSGLNLIPLAMRWPASRFVGIDLAAASIYRARELARAAGVSNIEFYAVDLRDFEQGAPAGGFDFIIAHGFLSWVPDDVKAALFGFCQRYLAPAGIATVSFNLAAGWHARWPVVAKVRAIRQAGAADEMAALAILRSVTAEESPELPIIDDMLAKGSAILAFDDFGPINDPWPLDRFVNAAAAAGLRWLGESHPANNLPHGLGEPQLAAALARHDAADPLAVHLAADEATARTFRSAVLCRADAPLAGRLTPDDLLSWPLRAGPRWAEVPADVLATPVIQAVARQVPACLAMTVATAQLTAGERRDWARQIRLAIERGWLEPRAEPVAFAPQPPERPALNGLRLECARQGLPLVDIWHRPCSFPAGHYQVLAAMDGSLDQAGLAAWSRQRCPELAFGPWLRHLAGRGLFA